jgi:tetratricopeptide (TPR) repeat protein
LAEKDRDATQALPTFSEKEKKRARQWFVKAEDTRERREYDYAIECYITGLGNWPEAVEEGHMPLRALAIQRQQAGGKKPGIMDGMRKSMTGKDVLKSMLNAEHLLAMDPHNAGYVEGLIKNANKGGFLETLRWAAPLGLDVLKKDKKPNKNRFASFRQALIEAAEKASEAGDSGTETYLLEQAVQSLEFLTARLPTDASIKDELRDLAPRLTIARGKYEKGGDFRDSIQDADKQKLLHDSERQRQSDDTYETLVAAAKAEFEANRDVPGKINAYVDVLLKPERDTEENEAVDVLTKAFERSQNYSFKLRADDVRLRQLRRRAGLLASRARKSGSDDDMQQARLAAMEQRQVVLDVFRERVEKYPTDLRYKYKLGDALFQTGNYDEAIPVLQIAQQDPRHRVRCQLMLGRAFLDKGSPVQAAEVLRESLDRYELTDDTSKELLYWLGRSLEAAEKVDEAKDAYGKLLRQDYNYRDGDARQRLDALKEKH